MDPRLIHWPPSHWHDPRAESGSPNVGTSTYTRAALSIPGEALHLCSFRAHVRSDERRKRIQLPCLTATSNERTQVKVREERIAVHRAEWKVQGCIDKIGRIYDELSEGGRGMRVGMAHREQRVKTYQEEEEEGEER